MKRIQRLRESNPAINTLATVTLDQGITSEEEIKAVAKEMYEVSQDPVLLAFQHKRLTIRRLWNLKKMKYDAGPYKGKRIFSNRDSSKHIVTVLKAQGYNFKFANNLDFVHNLLKEHKVTKFSEFKQIIEERSPIYFGGYAQTQIDAMLEFGHLKD